MTALPAISRAVDAALARAGLPGAVVMAATGDEVIHASGHGDASTDAMYRIYSMTKLVGVLAALKAAEEGLLSLADPVSRLLPEFADLPVLDGFDGDVPRLRPQRTAATLHHLATHQAGCVYSEWNAPMRAYFRAKGIRGLDDSSLAGLCALPLAFDPGSAWGYGTGIDWLGLAVQRAADEPLDAYVGSRIFAPLGLDNLCFEIDDVRRKRLRPSGHLSPSGMAPLDMNPRENPEHYPMGAALYGDAADYLRLLQMILRGGEAVLTADSVASLFTAQTGPLTPMLSQSKAATADVDMFPGLPVSFALGGLRVNADAPGRRRAGSVGWAGMLNTHFWVDPTTGVAGVIMMQHLPFAEPNAMSVYAAFERALYAEL